MAESDLFDSLPEALDKLVKNHADEYSDLMDYIVKIKADWDQFIKTGNTFSVKHIRPEVLSSWKRSMEMEVDPYKLRSISLTPSKIKNKLKENRELIKIASPFLEVLASNLKGSGFRIDLLDKDLYILKQFGEPKALETASRQGSGIGVSRAEPVTGTNAINLAAVLGRPVQLVGPEHYNAELQCWTCSATPLFDENKKLIGVINVAGHFSKVHKHTLGMVIALGKAIEFSLNQSNLRKEKELAFKYIENIVDSISDGLIALDKKGEITILNRMAGKLLGLKTGEAVKQPAEEILGQNATILEALKTGKPVDNKELIFNSRRKHRSFIGNVLPIFNNGKVDGVLAVFKDLSNARGFVKNLVGFKAHFTFNDLKGNAPTFLKAVNLAKQAAALPSNILLLGESGTGKELFAQSIHNASNVSDGPFVGINCAAIPSELIESELFGYEGGAFTGAKREGQPGKFQLAKGGTLFLDEVNAMPVTTQAKLLRVLQNRVFTRVGGSQEIRFDARIIAASNCDLWEEVRQGNFREDLFFRLNVISIEIPPLRERKEDIPLLIKYFCQKHSNKLNFNFSLTDQAMEVAISYDWPGNVRELENVMERCAILAYSRNNQQIEKNDLLNYSGIKRVLTGSDTQKNKKVLTLETLGDLETIEKQVIDRTLKETKGNISRASKKLGITRKTLYKKIEKYNLKRIDS